VTTNPRPVRDPESVYRVVQLVAAHPDSWEAAARAGVEEAAKTIDDLRVAQVVQMDTTVRDGAVVAYRVKLKMSYRVDRLRTMAATGETAVVRRLLVVANRTAGGERLAALVTDRLAVGPIEIHLLVPALPALTPLTLGIDPLTAGHVLADPDALASAARDVADEAEERLAAQLGELLRLGVARATGEVGSADPIAAVDAVLARSSFDEIVLSTLPAGVSRWLKLDLPSRLQRRTTIPVTVIEQPEEL
jgi:flavin-binding protein dodecin